MKDAKTITIDAAGRLVIPKRLREKAGLEPGIPIRIVVRDDRVELEPAPRSVRLVRNGHLMVAVPEEKGDQLEEKHVRATRDRLRQRREL